MPISVSEIMEILPHRYPFLLIDRVISEPAELASGKLTAIKNITTNDTVVFGEFYPPLLLLESMAQASGVLAHYYLSPMGKDQQCYFASIKNARFYDVVKAGDQLHIEIQFRRQRRTIVSFSGMVKIGEKVVCTSEFMCARQ
ncbi:MULTISPECIES: 3-hydroxyacyl-ACP dehydratase FabZ [Proteus]|uniref:3-hydroxyacyl-ACP dehydratase FabZ n=1 Tax=Proteus TaxID=583 RepID=UPI000BFE62DB|nr:MULTISPECIES: 3-hydroxyacyl-ACP dehydratase FabZ [Proteus]ATN01283.1 beta-hydroxyacyl-ACP dehydratase [Proteus vulgaris]MBG2837309.1 3-hydroxyacyl-ACP dehydratase FabZ [Proteus terrae subsp. cibarius]MBG2869887.1 3-hydroxyacyl-ACP dehydratase FabZ [Proteus terrae subsp. cibarius]MCO7050982.1 3-hydroxyacyl-ACP dehydratase FabZ [Proteus terrae]MCS6713357.1 3-hydroxyacyl-ACP dehydratase FabZ [Proteus terrae]